MQTLESVKSREDIKYGSLIAIFDDTRAQKYTEAELNIGDDRKYCGNWKYDDPTWYLDIVIPLIYYNRSKRLHELLMNNSNPPEMGASNCTVHFCSNVLRRRLNLTKLKEIFNILKTDAIYEQDVENDYIEDLEQIIYCFGKSRDNFRLYYYVLVGTE